MPSGFWDYIHVGRTRVSTEDDDLRNIHRNLQEGLFQIASQTCNILVQVNNTNNINNTNNFNLGGSDYHYTNQNQPSTSKKTSFHEVEHRVVLLQPKKEQNSPQRTRFSRLSEYKRRLSVS
jgi:membrane-anchored protein YejM (alkaline phosphatase superfamily)